MRGGSIASNAVTSLAKPTDYKNILGGASSKKSTKKPIKKHRGGSQASDAVIKAVPSGAFEKMNTLFTNMLGGSLFNNFKIFNQEAGNKKKPKPKPKTKAVVKKSKKIHKGGQCSDVPITYTPPAPAGVLPSSPHTVVDLSGAQPGVVSSLSQPLSPFNMMESRTLYPSYYASYTPVLANGGKKKPTKPRKH